MTYETCKRLYEHFKEIGQLERAEDMKKRMQLKAPKLEKVKKSKD